MVQNSRAVFLHGLDTWREKTKRFLRIILKTGNDNAI